MNGAGRELSESCQARRARRTVAPMVLRCAGRMGGEVDGVVGEKRGPSGDGDASGDGEAPSMGARRRCGRWRCWPAGGS